MFDDIPLFPLELVLLPDEVLPLHIFEPRYRELVARCETDEPFAIVLRHADQRLADVACTARITQVLERFPDGRSNILTRGETPIRLLEVRQVHAYASARAAPLEDDEADDVDALAQAAIESFLHLAAQHGEHGVDAPLAGPQLSYRLAGRVELPHAAKQELLESRHEATRLRRVIELFAEIAAAARVADELRTRARTNGHASSPGDIVAGSDPT